MQLGLAAWHRYTLGSDPELLAELVAEDAVLHSPLAQRAEEGHAAVVVHLGAAGAVLRGRDFRYVRQLVDGPEACLEYETTVGGTPVNGVDLIRFDLEGRIADFTMMLRPVQAIDVVWKRMACELENT